MEAVSQNTFDPYFIKNFHFFITLNGLHNWPLPETLKKSEYSFYVVLKRTISKEVVRWSVMSLPLWRNVQMEVGLTWRRKVTDLLSIFTSMPLTGVFKIHFEFKVTLKTYNISLGISYFFFHLSIRKFDVKFGNCYASLNCNAN